MTSCLTAVFRRDNRAMGHFVMSTTKTIPLTSVHFCTYLALIQAYSNLTIFFMDLYQRPKRLLSPNKTVHPWLLGESKIEYESFLFFST